MLCLTAAFKARLRLEGSRARDIDQPKVGDARDARHRSERTELRL
jgi:hypothetical protein